MQRKAYVLIFATLIFIDQFSKYLIRHTGGFYICNKGIAFGITIYWGVIILAIIAIFFLLLGNHQETRNKKQTNYKHQFPTTSKLFRNLKNWLLDIVCLLSLGNCFLKIGALSILSGAISNIIDRVCFGCVIDFINLHFWPVFNLADVYITIGAIMIIIKYYVQKSPLGRDNRP